MLIDTTNPMAPIVYLQAGPYSGILFGITNTFAQIPGFLTPLLVSEMTQTVSNVNRVIWSYLVSVEDNTLNY